MALATLVAALRTKELHSWYDLKPVEWLGTVNPFMMLGAVYGIYVLYHLLFRAMVGHTVGESLLGTASPRRSVGAGRLGK